MRTNNKKREMLFENCIDTFWERSNPGRGSRLPVLRYYAAHTQLFLLGHCRLSASSKPALAGSHHAGLRTAYRFAQGYFARSISRGNSSKTAGLSHLTRPFTSPNENLLFQAFRHSKADSFQIIQTVC